GTSEVEHVLATQCMVMKKSKAMLIRVDGKVGPGITAKDITLAVIGKIGSGGGTGYAIEYAGEAIRDLSMEGRMTLCNMAIEAGAPITEIKLDKIFIGSCTNARIEDLRAAAQVVKGKHVAPSIKLAMVVPGSGLVKDQAEQEGLDKVFTEAGFEWRQPG